MPSTEPSVERKNPPDAHRSSATDELRGHVPIALSLFGLAVFESVVRFLRTRVGPATPHPDVTTTWLPIARETLAGVPVYLTAPADNKPPLFEYLNVVVAATGNYLAVFLLLVGLANGAVAYLLWRTRAERGGHAAGVVSGVLFLSAVPLVSGHAVNVRSFTVLGVLFALRSSRPIPSGLAVAAAGMFSQYAVFAVPGVAYDRAKSVPSERWKAWLLSFGLITIAGVSVSYLSLYVFWGEASFVAGVRRSIWSAERYVLEWTPSLWNSTSTWARLHGRTLVRVGGLLALGAVGSGAALRGVATGDGAWTLERQSLAFVGLFGLPLLVRPFRTYWMYPLPWLVLLSTTGLCELGDRLGVTDSMT